MWRFLCTTSENCMLGSRNCRHTRFWSPPWQITLMVIRLSVCIRRNCPEFCTSQFSQLVCMWRFKIVSFPASNCQGGRIQDVMVKIIIPHLVAWWLCCCHSSLCWFIFKCSFILRFSFVFCSIFVMWLLWKRRDQCFALTFYIFQILVALFRIKKNKIKKESCSIRVRFTLLDLALAKLPDVHNPQNVQLHICGSGMW